MGARWVFKEQNLWSYGDGVNSDVVYVYYGTPSPKTRLGPVCTRKDPLKSQRLFLLRNINEIKVKYLVRVQDDEGRD